MRVIKRKSKSTYVFRNKEGVELDIPGNATIEDLVKMGFRRIRLRKPEEPLEENEWRESGQR